MSLPHLPFTPTAAAVRRAVLPVALAALAFAAPAAAYSTDYADAPAWWPEPMTGDLRLQTTMADGQKVDVRTCVKAADQKGAAEFVRGADKLFSLFRKACDVRWERPNSNTFRRTEACADATTVHEIVHRSSTVWTQKITTTPKEGPTQVFIDQRAERLGAC